MTQTIINVPAAGAFDPTDIEITDDTSGAFLIKEGSNEYMRIDTTNGSELTQFKMPFTTGEFKYIQETSAGPYEFIKANATSVRLFPGSSGGGFSFHHMTVDTGGVEASYSGAIFSMRNGQSVSGSGARAYITSSGNSWTELLATGSTSKIQRLDGLKLLEVDTDGNSTFTLDETADARFRVMGNGAVSGGSSGAVTYLDIQTRNNNNASSEYIKLGLEPEANGRYFELTSNSAKLYCQNAKLDLNTAAATFTLYDDFTVRQYQSGKRILVCEDAQNSHEALTVDKTADSTFNIFAPSSGVSYAPAAGSSFKVRRRESGGTVDCLTIAPDSATTFTLDDTSGATFKVTDNGASPKTFFGATEGGNTFVQSDSSTFLDGGGAIYLRVGTSDRIRADGGALYLGGTGKFNIVDAGTPFYNRSTSLVDIGATTGTTVVNIQSDGAYKALKCTPTTTSQTFTLEFQDGSSANGVYAIEQHFAIYNAGTENCTIQATITSGRGSALGKDLSAGGSTSGELVAGMTLNAGKSALFKAVKWNKILTGAATAVDNQFMFQTIMVEA